jgi:MFS family permease
MGWLAERYGRKPMMATNILGTGGGLILAGLADTPLNLGLALPVM